MKVSNITDIVGLPKCSLYYMHLVQKTSNYDVILKGRFTVGSCIDILQETGYLWAHVQPAPSPLDRGTMTPLFFCISFKYFCSILTYYQPIDNVGLS